MKTLKTPTPSKRTKPIDVFWYWIEERQRIFHAQQAGEKKPWTKDKILQQYRFCNVFRTQDTVTKHYMRWIQPTFEKPPSYTIFNTGLYRLINWPDTMDEIGPILGRWLPASAITKMRHRKEQGLKVFTGAYVIPPGLGGGPKHESIIKSFDEWWKFKLQVSNDITVGKTLENAFHVVQNIHPIIGPFLAYEIVTDLSYHILAKAPDIHTWANAGPGAIRGLNRIHGRELKAHPKQDVLLDEMIGLLWDMERRFPEWDVTMREVEHSLCETDKYLRALIGVGRPKAKYQGVEV